MQSCALTNLVTGGLLGLLTVFAGCTTLQSTAPVESSEEQVAHSDPAPSDPAPSAAAPTEPSSDTSDAPGEPTANPSDPGDGKSRTFCPLDTTPGSKAPETAGVAGKARDSDSMAKIVAAHRGCVRRCYESVQKDIPGLKGDLTITLKITPKGAVKEATLNRERSNLFAPKMVECAVGVLKQLEFGAHAKGFESTLNYPFNFQP